MDIRQKNQRAAMEKSLEYLDWFASDFFPAMNTYSQRVSELRKTLMERATEEAERKAIRNTFIKASKIEIDLAGTFSKNERELSEYTIVVSSMGAAGASNVLNQLEYFAAAMTCGLADENLAFNPLSDAYCELVESLYLPLCRYRGDNDKLYSNLIKLYRIWKSRINKEVLEGKRKELSDKISQIKDTNITPFGL